MRKPKLTEATHKKIGRPGVTREEVLNAIRALSREGGPIPTLRRVQSHLGGGSLATISKFRQELADAYEDVSEDPLEVKAVERITAFVREFRNDANAAADSNADKLVRDAEHTVKAAYEARDKIRISRDHVAETAEKSERQVAKLEKRVDELEQKLSALNQERDALQSAFSDYERTQSNTQASYEKEVLQLKNALEQMVKEKDAETALQKREIGELKSIKGKLQKELLAAKTKLDHLKTDFNNANNNFLATKERVTDRDKTIAILRTQSDKLIEWQDEAKANRKQLSDENERLQSECKLLVKENNQMLVELSKRDKELEARDSDLINHNTWHDKIVEDKDKQIADLHREMGSLKHR